MNLSERIESLRAEQPRLRARDLAQRLDLSEAEVVASRQWRENTRLRADWETLLARLPQLGEVMALTRNETAVHERRGTYGEAQGQGTVRMVLGAEIDLRLFLHHWYTVWAVEEGGKRSIQIFDPHGDAVHKIWLGEQSNLDAWQRLVAELREEELAPPPLRRGHPAPERPDGEIDQAGFQAGWRGLKDTHEFHFLLRRFGVGRLQAMRLAPPELVEERPIGALAELLTRAAGTELPIMVFVGNPGCIQIHSGPVARIVERDGWLNVLDPRFNLHIRQDRLASVWRVHKPTVDGLVSSLEVFDVDGTLAVQLFGVRKPGQAQDPRWAALLGPA